MNNNSIAAFEMTYDAAPISEVFTQHGDIPNTIDNSVNQIGNKVNKMANSNLNMNVVNSETKEKLDEKNESSTNIMNYIMANNMRNNKSNDSANTQSDQMIISEENDTTSDGPIPVESSSDLVQFMDESNLDLKNNIDDKSITDVSNIIKDVMNENEIMSEENIGDVTGNVTGNINKIINTDNVTEEAAQAEEATQDEEAAQAEEEQDENKVLLNKINFLKGDIDNIYYELEKMKSIIENITNNTFLSKLNVFIEDNNKNLLIMLSIFVLLIFFIQNNKRTIPVVYRT